MSDEFHILRVEDARDLPLPRYMTGGSAGMDLYANVTQDTILGKGQRKLIPTGIKISIPMAYEAQIRPRSGLAINYGVTLLNSPGTVDADYRGEIKVIMINHGEEDFVVKRGDRIAQMVITSIHQPKFLEVLVLDDTSRGSGGFGHTGI